MIKEQQSKDRHFRIEKTRQQNRPVTLTGDAKTTAEKVAKEIGMDKVCSELLPADQVK